MNNPSIEDGTFQYKVNGNLVTMKNVDIASGEYVTFAKHLKGNIWPETTYIFNGQKGVNNFWIFIIASDSLKTGNYYYDSSTSKMDPYIGMSYNGDESAIYFSGDYIDISITSYSNGFISGTMTAKMTPVILTPNGIDYSKRGTTVITEGKFKNIKCIY